MSKQVDERVVSMQFDNAHFEKNVSTTMSTLDKLKHALKLDGASKGLENIDTASKKVNMTSLGSAVETVSAKFSALQVMGVTALANITNSAVNAGKRIASALTIDPIKTGFSEYETQINAVQTILANTSSKGTTLDQVNTALDELNHYADKTIYNFTQMTKNIGTFTAAGIDLDTSVSAIQGIANLAAVSGSTSQQASTAMYQLSQALASGTVKLMDWNSVVNAGMGGQVFQDALKETSKLLGTGAEAAIKAKGSFRESLSTGWLTAEVLTETLKKMTTSGANEYVAEYTGLSVDAVQAALDTATAQYGEADAIKEASKALAEKSGKNADEIESVLSMAKTAEDAATKVKTFSQLWDTLKEAAQSGWTQTWEIIVGDFEEAKELLTSISDTVGNFINASAESRNNMLEGAMTSGWDKLVEKINAAGVETDAFENKVKETIKEHGGNVDELVKKYGSLEKAFQSGAISTDILREAVGGLKKSFTDLDKVQRELKINDTGDDVKEVQKALMGLGYDMEEFGADGKYGSVTQKAVKAFQEASNLKVTGIVDDETLAALEKASGSAVTLNENIDELVDGVTELGGRQILIESFKNIFQAICDVIKPVSKAFKEIFPPMTSERLLNLIKGFKSFTEKLKISEDAADKIYQTFKGLFSVLDIGLTIIKAVAKGVVELISKFKGVAGGLLSGSASLGDFLSNLRDSVKETNFFGNGVDKVVGFLSKAIDKIKEFNRSLTSGFKSSDFSSTLGFFKGLWSIITKVGSAILKTFGSIGSTISEVLGKGDIFEVLNSGLIAGILLGINKFTSGLKDAVDNVGGFMENVTGILDDVRGCFEAYQQQLKAGALLKIAAAIAILAASLFLLSTIDANSLGTAIAAITVLFAELVGSMALMNKFGGKSRLFDTTAVKMIAMSVSILILASALKSLSGLSWEQMAVGLVAISALLWELVAVSIVMSKTGSKMVKGSLGLIALAAAMKILASVCKDFATMSWEDIRKGLAAIGGLLLEISIFENIAGKAKHVVSTGISMLLIGAAMKILASVLSDLASMKWEHISKGITTMGIALAELAIAMKLMPKGSVFKATGLVIAVASLKLLANVLSDFGGMEWRNIGRGLAAMGGVLVELAIGLNLMKSTLGGAAALMVAAIALAAIAPVMKTLGNMSWEEIAKGLITLAGAFIVIGIAGVLLKPLIVPILALAAAFVLFGAGMVGIGAGITLIAAGITALATALSVGATMIVAGLTVIVTGILELIPTIARIIGKGVVELAKVIGEYAPQLAESCLQLVSSVLKSLAEHAPQITDSLAEFLIGVINSLTNHMPALIEALINLLASVFDGLGKALKSLDVGSLRDGIDAALGLSALMLAMSAALKIAGGVSVGNALKGILALTAMAVPLLAFVGVLALMDGVENATNNAIALAALAGACSLMLIPLTLVGAIVTTGIGAAAIIAGILALTAMAIPMLAFVGVLALMNKVENATTNAMLLIALMTVMTDLLVKVALVAPLAVIGVAAMSGLTLLMGAIGAMAVAVGALMDKFPSLEKFLNKGLPILEQLAGSIGTMIGKFVGNLGEALGDSLVKIGEDIAEFMAKLAEASDNASGIKSDAFDGVEKLMGIMLEIGGTSIGTGLMDGISRLFNFGDDSMETFEKNGVEFFNAMKAIGEASSEVDINKESVDAILSVAERLADLQSHLQPIGGVISWFTGRDDLGTFGINAAAFMISMKTAFGSLDDTEFNTQAMDAVISSATSLAKLQSHLEPIGGVVTWFKGRDDLGTFGYNVASFIYSMKMAFAQLDGAEFNTEAMDSIISTATSLAKLQSHLEPIGGVISWFAGRDDLGTFGVNAASFIYSMKIAFAQLDGAELNTEAMDSIISAATSLARLQTSLEPIGGVITWFTGRDDLGTFGINVAAFISSMKFAFTQLDGVELNIEAMNSIISASTKLAELQSHLEPIGGVVDWFTGRDDLGTFGTNVAAFIGSMKTALVTLDGVTLNEEAMSSIITAATKLAELQSSLEPMGGVVSWFSGRTDLGAFGTNIGLFADAMGKLKTGMGENGITEAVITSITNTGTALIELQKALPEEHWFDGKMNLTDFAGYIYDFGTAMGEFGTQAANIDSGAVSTVISTAYRIKSLIESLVDLDTSGVEAFTGVGTGGFGADGPAYDIACAIAKFSDKVADIDTEAVTVAVTAARKLKSLIAGLVGLDTSGIENFKPQSIGSAMKGYADKVAGIDAGAVSSSISAANRLKNFISSLSGLDTSGISNFKVSSIGSSLKAYGSSVSGVDMSAVSSSISAANRLKNFISSLAGLDTGGVGSFKIAIDQLSTVNIAGLVKAFSGASAKLSTAGADMINGLIKGMQSKLPAVTAVSTKIAMSANKAVTSKASAFATAGGNLAAKLASGFSSKKGVVSSAVSSCLSSAASKIRDKYSSFYNAGSYLVTGFKNGISENSYKAAAKAKAMAEAAAEAARKALKINSPSKVFKAIGSGIPEGFAMGIGMLGSTVDKSVSDMASTAVNSARSTMGTILDALSGDMDAQPTIRPVVDLSDVKTGVNAIGGLFAGTQSIGVQSNLNAINLTMNRKLQNGTNDDIISAINKLNDGLEGNRGDTYNFAGITYDNGNEISDAVQTLVRAAKMGRRV